MFMRKAFTALSYNGISGDYLEFGSWGGLTFSLAHKESRLAWHSCKLWSFDSFKGLPPAAGPEDAHPRWGEGAMEMGLEKFRAVCRRNGIPESDYVTVPGFYADTIGKEDQIEIELPKDVALAYVDCDLYSSTTVVLDFLAKRMKHGMMIAFDDYYCYTAQTLSGERKACLDFLQKDSRSILLPSCNSAGMACPSFLRINRSTTSFRRRLFRSREELAPACVIRESPSIVPDSLDQRCLSRAQ
jgi:hypothetical protein